MDIFNFDGEKIFTLTDCESIKQELGKIHDIIPAYKGLGKNIYFSNSLKRFYLVDDECERIIKRYSIIVRGVPEVKRSEKGFTSLYITLTNACPLKCIYCFGAGGARKGKTADWNMIKAAIDYVSQFNEKNIDMDFSGTGEQALAFKLLKKTVQYAREKLDIIRIKISTSGVINKEVCKWIAKNIDTVQVSLDGPPEIHDLQRPLKDGSPSSPYVLKTIKRLQEFGANYHVRANITKLLLDNIEYTIRFFRDLGIERALFVRLKPIGRASRLQIPSPEESVKAMLKSVELREELGMPAQFGREVDIFAPFGRPIPRVCNLGYNFCLGLDGTVSTCFMYTDEDDLKILPGMKEFIFGHFNKKKKTFEIDTKKLKKLRNLVKEFRCGLCDFKLCLGGCPYMNVYETGDITIPSQYMCRINSYGYRESLKYKVYKTFIKKKPCLIEKDGKLFFALHYTQFEVAKLQPHERMLKNPWIKITFPYGHIALNNLSKKIIDHHKKNPKALVLFLLSFDFRERGKIEELKMIEHFLSTLKANNIFFRVTKPLRPFFDEMLREEVCHLEEKYNIPSECRECLELFTINEEQKVRYCNGLVGNYIDEYEDRNQLFNFFKRNSKKRCYDNIFKKDEAIQ